MKIRLYQNGKKIASFDTNGDWLITEKSGFRMLQVDSAKCFLGHDTTIVINNI